MAKLLLITFFCGGPPFFGLPPNIFERKKTKYHTHPSLSNHNEHTARGHFWIIGMKYNTHRMQNTHCGNTVCSPCVIMSWAHSTFRHIFSGIYGAITAETKEKERKKKKTRSYRETRKLYGIYKWINQATEYDDKSDFTVFLFGWKVACVWLRHTRKPDRIRWNNVIRIHNLTTLSTNFTCKLFACWLFVASRAEFFFSSFFCRFTRFFSIAYL